MSITTLLAPVVQQAGLLTLSGRDPVYTDSARMLFLSGVYSCTVRLPSCEARYVTIVGPMRVLGEPLSVDIEFPRAFNASLLMATIRSAEDGEVTYLAYLHALWAAGISHYTVTFEVPSVTYFSSEREVFAWHP